MIHCSALEHLLTSLSPEVPCQMLALSADSLLPRLLRRFTSSPLCETLVAVSALWNLGCLCCMILVIFSYVRLLVAFSYERLDCLCYVGYWLPPLWDFDRLCYMEPLLFQLVTSVMGSLLLQLVASAMAPLLPELVTFATWDCYCLS